MIFDEYNGPLTPATYPWAQEGFEAIMKNPWSYREPNMTSDISDWKDNIPEIDKQAIAGILLGFTELEKTIGAYWRDLSTMFNYPELIGFCSGAAYSEVVHGYGYKHLEDTLGLNTYEQLNTNVYAQSKLAHFNLPSETPIEQLPFQIALLSGCGEGVSLFSSFAILLSYRKAGYMKGLGQILSWSIRDENLHSDIAALIFKELCKDFPDYEPTESQLHQAFYESYKIEKAFVKDALAGDNLLNIDYLNVRNFIRERCNDRLAALGYFDPLFTKEETINNIEDWFYPMTLGTVKIDFFAEAHNGGAYSATAGSNLDGFDFSSL